MLTEVVPLLNAAGVTPDDETLFNIFQVVTLNFAATASEQPTLRKFMGIREGLFS